MKKLTLIILLIAVCGTYLKAQSKIKEGKITFQMTYPDSGQSESLKKMLPMSMVTYFKNGNVRSEMDIPGRPMVVIKAAHSEDMYMLMEMHGNKMAMKMNKEEANRI